MAVFFENLTTEIVALLVILQTLCIFYVYRVYTTWHRLGVKYLKPTFPFGNFGPVVMQKKSFCGLTQDIYNSTAEPLIGIYSAYRPSIIIRDSELMRDVFIKDFQYFHDRGLYINEEHDPLSGSILQLSGEKWRNLRAKFTPSFTSGKLKAIFPTLIESNKPLVKFMNEAAAIESTVNVHELLAQYTTNIIASVAFGIDIDCIADPNQPFRVAGRKV